MRLSQSHFLGLLFFVTYLKLCDTYIIQFPPENAKEFTSKGGLLHCCNCNDYLRIPSHAVRNSDKVMVIQSYPFISHNDATDAKNLQQSSLSDNYKIIVVKEYQAILVNRNSPVYSTLTDRETVCDYQFAEYVEIVINCKFTEQTDFRLRYSVNNGALSDILTENERKQINTGNKSLPYYAVVNGTLRIFTTHFCLFLVEVKLENTDKNELFAKINKLTGDSEEDIESLLAETLCKKREVKLVVHGYYSTINASSSASAERNVKFCIYLRDIKHKDNEKLKEITEEKLRNNSELSFKKLILFDEPIPNPPKIIRRQTKFQCFAIFSKNKICDKVRDIICKKCKCNYKFFLM